MINFVIQSTVGTLSTLTVTGTSTLSNVSGTTGNFTGTLNVIGDLTINGMATTTASNGNLEIEGDLTIGGGTAISQHLSGTATNLVSASIASSTCGDYGTITVTGAEVGDTVYASPDANSSSGGIEDSNLVWNAVITSTSTVTIRACNPTITPIDASNDQEWRADVWKH